MRGLWFGGQGSLAAPARNQHPQLFGVTEHDPLPLAAAFGMTLGVAIAAGFLPAWRASRVDPNQAIRYE